MNENTMYLLKNKDFIFRCLEILTHSNCPADLWLKVLLSSDTCHNLFSMQYPILQEVSRLGSVQKEMFLDCCGRRRYYPDIFKFDDRQFIVCNDWYYGNRRDTRTPFIKWIKQITARCG